MKYYQPAPASDGSIIDKFGTEYYSFEVWRNKSVCESLFPNYVIVTYKDGDIEDPTFVD